MAGANNAVKVCLGVRPGEKVVVMADERSRSVAASLESALGARGAKFTGLLLEDFGPRPMTTAPEPLLAALEDTDVGVLCMTPQPGELGAHTLLHDFRGYSDHVRITDLPPLHYAYDGHARADYRKVDELSECLRERMVRAETLTVKTEAGTSFKAHFNPELDWVKTSGLISPRYWSNLPAGEVFTTPATVDGIFVCDATAGDYFNGKYGDLQATPLVMEISAGRLKRVECPRKDLEEEFWSYCHTDENSDRVGELAFGTNLGLSHMIGILLQDEKFPGVHIAFGDPYGSQTHANWKSRTHVDVLTRNCNVWIDGDQIIRTGHYQLDHLGLG